MKIKVFKLNYCFVLMVILTLLGCSETDEIQHIETCLDRLDRQQYESIINDNTCSNYERASAELGLGGVSVHKILQQSNTDNFVEMFNISLETFESNILHLQSAVALTENLIGANRPLTEIHLLGSVASMINETWGQVDANLDGDIEDSEFMDFLKIDSASTQSSGLSSFQVSDEFQLVDTDNNAWIWVKDELTWRADANFDGIADGAHVSLPASATLSQVAFITKITELQSLFTTDSTSDLQASFDFLASSTSNASIVDQDLGYLGISTDNVVREIIDDSIDQLDNGGTCRRSVVTVVDAFSNIISNAATSDTVSEYQTHNLLSLDQVQAISSDAVFYIPSIPGNIDISGATFKARILYQKTGSPTGFTGLYQNADNEIKSPLINLKFLTIDSSGQQIESEAGDGVITLKELLCF